jgi:integrase/recombinase XerC
MESKDNTAGHELSLNPSFVRKISEWLEYLKGVKKHSKHTLKAYATDFYLFLEFINSYTDKIIDEDLLTSLEIRDFRSWLANRKTSAHKSTSNARALSTLKSFFRFMKKHYGITNDAVFTVTIKKVEKPLPKSLSIQNAMQVITNTDLLSSETWVAKRNKAVLMLLYGAGLRVSEALSLQFNQIPKNEQPLNIIGKGNKEAPIYLLPEVIESIEVYTSSCPHDLTSGPLFVGVRGGELNPSAFRKELKSLVRTLNLPEHTSPHSFRHSFATHLLAKGGDIRVIQELLRHDSISTTQRYTKVDPSHLIESYKSFHPRSDD